MNICYVTSYDSSDPSNWSGLGYNIWRAIEGQGHHIHRFQVTPSGRWCHYLERLMGSISRVSGRRHLVAHSTMRAKYQARQVDRWIGRHPDIDAIVSPGTIPVAFMSRHKPLITWSDTTHTLLFHSYPEYSNISKLSHWEGDQIERNSLARSSAAIFSSDWAANSAVNDYNAPRERVHVVPFGANLDKEPDTSEIFELITARASSSTQILFVGVDWERKGGNHCLELVRYLRKRDVDATMRIAGCEPPEAVRSLPWVHSEGFLDKRSEEGKRRLDLMFRSASILVVPSVAECYGLVYCEANAYGVPAIGRDVGGVSTIIRDGENGLLMGDMDSLKEDGERIFTILRDINKYKSMCLRARHAFDERLNWKVAGQQACELIERCLQ